MKRNSNFKSISFTNFEFISIFVLLSSCALIGNIPQKIIKTCGSASFIGIILITIIAFILFKYISKKIFKNEFDFYQIIKKTYPTSLQKVIGIMIYAFSLFFVYILINNMILNLKITTYNLSTTFDLGIFFTVGLFLMVKKGFNSIFRIAGYFSIVIVVFILILFLTSIPSLSFSNYFPLFGNGFRNVLVNNLENITFFTPLFFTLLFGGNIINKKRSNEKNYNKLFTIMASFLFMIIIMFVGAMPEELLNTRFTLLFDISRIISFSTTSVKIGPIMIFLFSIMTFLATSFLLLISCLSLERLKVIKDYSKIVIISVLIIAAIFVIPQSLDIFNKTLELFNLLSIIICFILPIVTVIIYSIKNKDQKRFQEVKTHE